MMNFKRFERQIQIPEIGIEGQRKIKRAKVLLIGAGGLGSPVAYYLAAAGVGRIGIADGDRIEVSNLNRQVLHSPERTGMLKAESAEQTIRSFSPETKVSVYAERLSSVDEITRIMKGYDVIVDCCDNYPTRFAMNTACIQSHKPFVYGAVSEFEGQVMTIIPGKGACYQCLYPSAPLPSEMHTSSGVIGVSPGTVGCIQATEALKYILGVGVLLVGRLLFIDLLEMTFSLLAVERNKSCPACANERC